MAKPQKKQVKKAEWKGYHRVNLSKENAAEFDVWRVSCDIQFSDFDVLANDGYKLSFAWDDYHQGVSASLYCTSAKMEWAGYSLTAWAGDAESALQLLFFKHFVMCNQKWEVAPERSQNEGLPYG